MTDRYAARIYYLHPLLAGPVASWDEHLHRIAGLGFDSLLIAPPFVTGRSGNLFVTADHARVNPALAHDGEAASLFALLAEKCRVLGLSLMLDLAPDRIAAESSLMQSHPRWLRGGVVPSLDPRREPVALETAEFRHEDAALSAEIVQWWAQQLSAWSAAGVAGYRCLGLRLTPATFWQALIAAVRVQHPASRFIAWTPGLSWQQIDALAGSGFDALSTSACWWNFRDAWFPREQTFLRNRSDSLLAFPESPFDGRLPGGTAPIELRKRAARRSLRFTTAVADSWLMTMGFEYGAREALHPARGTAEEFARLQAAPEDRLDAEIREANQRIGAASRHRGAALLSLSAPAAAVAALLRGEDGGDPRQAEQARLVLINADLNAAHPLSVGDIVAAAGGRLSDWIDAESSAPNDRESALAPGEVRLLKVRAAAPVQASSASRARRVITAALRAPRLAIENVQPAVDDGRFALRRIVGETLVVEADIFTDGHEQLAAALLWRPMDQSDWQEVPMRSLGNDRWAADFTPLRIGRHEYSVLGWLDLFGHFRSGLAKKHAAGIDLKLELQEGRRLLEKIVELGEGDTAAVDALVNRLAAAKPARQLELLLATATADAVDAARYRPHSLQKAAMPLEAERLAARHASWYELFPRSQTDDASRHGSFDDVIARLPSIREMGFDVLYFPPIHPIGKRNRKGRNNSLVATKDDPGSPYAIGSNQGGHEAIHPQLGSFEDFRRLRQAAFEHGLEIALDFAIQCSPDHPWLASHPGWFAWRPDGTIRYAENPPKKYEDIVNVDFYAADAMPALWTALRDIVLLWVGEGVKIFRVDNPHTKPLPFWEWLIADVRGRDPQVIFLAEAFTRPTMMYRLGKIGFSQSYTYFTWRNHKQELAEYFTQLNTAPVSEFYRPHFFVNTPDINPLFLQGSGRAGFLIRAALATMSSGLWGMYSGFELCESAAVPGKEDYLDSEKYEIRPRDWYQPGNIIGEITQLNRIRRENPALQTHLGFRLYNAWNDRILYFGKATADRRNFILVAISLDPHQPQEADFEIPLWEFGLPDHASLQGEDLMNGHRWTWHGKHQHLRLDPSQPFGIWRVAV